MTDLNKKQAFWAEQLPLFKEKYWLPEHLDVLEFNMDGGCFEIPIDVKTDLSEDDLFDIYHRVNSGWAMWKKAVTFMQEKAKAQAVQQSFEIGRLQDRITELLDERQDLYAQINNDQAVPETHIVVPKQPTPKMIDATWDFDDEIIEMSSNTRNEFIWKKMVEASESGAEG